MKLTVDQTDRVLECRTAVEQARRAADQLVEWPNVPDAAYELRELMITAQGWIEDLMDQTSPAD